MGPYTFISLNTDPINYIDLLQNKHRYTKNPSGPLVVWGEKIQKQFPEKPLLVLQSSRPLGKKKTKNNRPLKVTTVSGFGDLRPQN
jgi:hypothetical protein